METVARSLSHRRRIMAPSYSRKILATAPIAYWPLDEVAGSVARCLVNPAQNGAVTGVTWAHDNTGPFGTPAPYFDGANDYIEICTAAFQAAFNGPVGSMMIWMKVFNAAVWTDGIGHFALSAYIDNNNRVGLTKSSVDNTTGGYAIAGAGTASLSHSPYTNTDWFHNLITWSDANNDDEAKGYIDGVQEEPTSNAMNAWAGGALNATRTLIGSYTDVPSNPFYGWLAHAAFWDRVLTAEEVRHIFET